MSCTVVTTAANEAIAPLHDRMPVLLEAADWAAWLDPDNDDVAGLHGLLAPAPDGAVQLRRVGRAVGDVRNDGPELLDPPVEPGPGPSSAPAEPALFELDDHPTGSHQLSLGSP